jgi:phosphoglycerate kinase
MQSFVNLDLNGKRVLLRADLNVPTKDGKIEDYNRIKRLKPTIDLLRKKGALIILTSHFGRPNGEKLAQYSLQFLVPELKEIYGCEIVFAPQIDDRALTLAEKGKILLLENLRFYPGEEANDEGFAQRLASFADIYINDAFACSHRAHASVVAITKYLPSYAGLLLLEEVKNLQSLLTQETKPLAAIIGGKKVSTKFKVLNFMSKRCDYLVICGAMANTMLAAQGYDMQGSLVELELIEQAKEFLSSAPCQVVLPRDVVVADEGGQVSLCDVAAIKKGASVFDIGVQSCLEVLADLEKCQTLLWNGPFGMFEDIRFRCATDLIARQVAVLTQKGKLRSIAGGGDTIAVLEQSGLISHLSYVSTAGGAFLEWLESGDLPGLKALN